MKEVALYVGLPAYKVDPANEVNAEAKNEWINEHDILKRQVEFIRERKKLHKQLNGFVFYNNFNLFKAGEAHELERQNLKQVL